MRRGACIGAIVIATSSGCSPGARDGQSVATEPSTASDGPADVASGSTPPSDPGTGDGGGTGATSGGDPPAGSTSDGTTGDTTGGAPIIPWEEGSIRVLPAIEVDLVAHVLALEHPNAGEYVALTPERETSVGILLDALGDTLATTLADPAAADWCGVLDLAAAAGYDLQRLRDVTSGRWLIYGSDATGGGQAYFFVNPQAKRDLVIEVPHHPFDSNTSQEGAHMLLSLSARALLLAKEHRCSDPDVAECQANTSVCDGVYRESDVAHDPRNAFHVLHTWYVAHGEARFVQLHGFNAPPGDLAEIGDGTNNDVDPRSIANVFAAHLATLVDDPSAVFSCQAEPGDPPTAQCGGSNVQAHATHAPQAGACPSTGDGTNRFLHVEQSGTLRDEDESDGASWMDVRDATLLTWPDCTLGEGPLDCELGPAQAIPRACVCGQPCR